MADRRKNRAMGPKLSKADVALIRAFGRAGYGPTELSRHFPVTREHISRILSGRYGAWSTD